LLPNWKHERHEEVQALLGDAATIADQDRFRALSREYAQLSDVSAALPTGDRCRKISKPRR
jgi:protein subunit release factor A